MGDLLIGQLDPAKLIEQYQGDARLFQQTIVELSRQLLAVRATPSAEQKVGLWMPIETAPRDGTSVWITRADGYMVVARNWGGAWFKDSGAYASECTHWQPVPAALASSDR